MHAFIFLWNEMYTSDEHEEAYKGMSDEAREAKPYVARVNGKMRCYSKEDIDELEEIQKKIDEIQSKIDRDHIIRDGYMPKYNIWVCPICDTEEKDGKYPCDCLQKRLMLYNEMDKLHERRVEIHGASLEEWFE